MTFSEARLRTAILENQQKNSLINLVIDENQTLLLQDLADYTPFTNKYFSSKRYLEQTAKKKQADLWAQITSMSGTVGGMPDFFTLFNEPMTDTFDAVGDAMPKGRVKMIHSRGAVGKVKLISSGNHPFTGIFRGGDYGICRFSAPGLPDLGQNPLAGSIAVKFLKDGMDSSNLVAMFSPAGNGNWNFFNRDFSNILPIPGSDEVQLRINKLFAEVTPYTLSVGLTNYATNRQNGFLERNIKTPFKLRFEAHPDVATLFPSEAPKDPMYFTHQLTTIPANSTLFKVYGWTAPKEEGGVEVYIGDLVLDGEVVKSKWADESLFFKHERVSADFVA
jgi:hypothetical protein